MVAIVSPTNSKALNLLRTLDEKCVVELNPEYMAAVRYLMGLKLVGCHNRLVYRTRVEYAVSEKNANAWHRSDGYMVSLVKGMLAKVFKTHRGWQFVVEDDIGERYRSSKAYASERTAKINAASAVTRIVKAKYENSSIKS